jgi:23S rRNA pseudouridine1911/1915/1917 synthase
MSSTLPTLYEDQAVLVINKPAGLPVHPADSYSGETVTDLLGDQYFLVHRLDKDTTGVIVLAKSEATQEFLRQQFKNRQVQKEYLALVHGTPKNSSGVINQPIARSKKDGKKRVVATAGRATRGHIRDALTNFEVLASKDNYSLLKLKPKTGRMHQIRVHLHYLGHPIVGDKLYKFKRQVTPSDITHQQLHAHKLTVQLPSAETKTFTAQPPSHLLTP